MATYKTDYKTECDTKQSVTSYYEMFDGRSGQTTRQKLRRFALNLLSKLQPEDAGSGWIRPIYGHQIYDEFINNYSRILEYCKNLGDFISTDDLVSALRSGDRISGRYFHLSFDDGLASVLDNGLELFAKFQIRPLLFVNPSIIELTEEAALKEHASKRLGLPKVPKFMTWDEIRNGMAAGCDIGAHTSTHRRLTEISENKSELHNEIARCKRQIEEQTNSECRYFSWPYGTRNDIDQASLNFIRDSGFVACFSAIRGSILSGKTDRFYIPRHHVEDYFSFDHARYFVKGGFEKLTQ